MRSASDPGEPAGGRARARPRPGEGASHGVAPGLRRRQGARAPGPLPRGRERLHASVDEEGAPPADEILWPLALYRLAGDENGASRTLHILERLSSTSPDYYRVMFARALSSDSSEDRDATLRRYEQDCARQLGPFSLENSGYHSAHVLLLIQARKLPEAEAALARLKPFIAFSRFSRDSTARQYQRLYYNAVALLKAEEGNVEAANSALAEAVAIDPRSEADLAAARTTTRSRASSPARRGNASKRNGAPPRSPFSSSSRSVPERDGFSEFQR